MIGFISEKSKKDFPRTINNNNDNSQNNRQIFPDCPWVTEEYLDLHPDFKTNPNLLRKWVKDYHTRYRDIKYWLEIVKPDEADFTWWIGCEKAKQFSMDSQERFGYFYPEWLKMNNVDINALREEYKKWKENNP